MSLSAIFEKRPPSLATSPSGSSGSPACLRSFCAIAEIPGNDRGPLAG